MSTLETQYKNFLNNNPNIKITFEEWKNTVLNEMLITIKSMDDDSDLSDCHITEKIK
jgi:hypothetical protein